MTDTPMTIEQIFDVGSYIIRKLSPEEWGDVSWHFTIRQFSIIPKGGTYITFIKANGLDVRTATDTDKFAQTVQRLFGEAYGKLVLNKDGARYPHLCRNCGAPAYVGFSSVDCSRKCGA